MISRFTLMRAAWRRYRDAYGRTGGFRRWAFREALRIEWAIVRHRIAQAKEAARIDALRAMPLPDVIWPQRDLSPLERALEACRYLPAHMSYERAAREVHASFAAKAR